MISSNKSMFEGHRRRLEWAERLRPSLDLFGRGFYELERKEDGLADYMFSVAIENDLTPSYFSEKLLDCFATATVPVYLGTPDIGDFFNADGIITLDNDFTVDSLSESLYHEMMPAILDNLEKVRHYDVGEDFLWEQHLRDFYGTTVSSR